MDARLNSHGCTAAFGCVQSTAMTTEPLARLLSDVAVALLRCAAVLSPDVEPHQTPVTDLSRDERELRQGRICDEIEQLGGAVPDTVFRRVAADNGYAGRGVAGFFRSNGNGLLQKSSDGTVVITQHGRDRADQYRRHIAVVNDI